MKQIIYITALCLLWSMFCYGQHSTIANTATQCPNLAIQLKVPNGNNTFYAISYCNVGNVLAENSYLEIHIDNSLTITQATQPLQYKSDNTYRFLIGNVEVGACGSMYFQIPQALSQVHCLSAFIATALPCTTQNIALNIKQKDGDKVSGNNDVKNTTAQAEIDWMLTEIRSPSDPIFEDHVFLDFVPTWDSLMRILDNSQTYSTAPKDSSGIDSLNLTVVPVKNNLPSHAVASFCTQQTATILSSDSKKITLGSSSNKKNGTLAKQQVLLYPNPVQQKAVLEINGYDGSIIELYIFNSLGQKIGYWESTTNHLSIQTGQWDRGVYFYHLYADGQVIHTNRFLVN